MADPVNAVKARLQAHAGVTALISGRVFFNHLPDRKTLPAATVSLVSSPRIPLFGGDADKVRSRIEVECWATTQAGAKALAAQSILALQRWAGTIADTVIHDVFVDDERDGYEHGAGLWSQTQDFFPWWSEA